MIFTFDVTITSISSLYLRVLFTAQADGDFDSCCQIAYSLIENAAKRWEEKREKRILFTRIAAELEQKHHLRAGWEGHHQCEGARRMCQPRAELRTQRFPIKCSYISKGNQRQTSHLFKVQDAQHFEQQMQSKEPPFGTR